MRLHTNSFRLSHPFTEHDAYRRLKKKRNVNTEQVISSVINSVYAVGNECHYFIIIKVSQTDQQASNSTSRLESREARS